MTYILLRNNKETGPMSLEALREAGLKSSDLVWVEGQSVCWLNPGDIQELKNLVGKPAAKTPVPEKTEPITPTASLTAEKKGIYVSLPVKEKAAPSYHGGMSAYQPHPEFETDLPESKAISPKEEAVIPETRYSRPLDELKELYAKNLEQRNNQRSFSLHIPPQLKKTGLYAGFIVIGIIAGMLIRNAGSAKNKAASNDATAQAPVDMATENKAMATEETAWIPDQPIPASAAPDQTMGKPVIEEKDFSDETMRRSGKPQSEVKERPREPVITGNDEKTITREQPAENEMPVREKRAIPAEAMASLVAVKSNDYEVGSFGGIKNLEVTLTNTSGYSLDRVTVEVQYLKPRDEFLKAERIQFHAIGPNGSQTVAVPKSTRGVKVRLKVVRIESDQFSGTTAGN